MRNLVDAEAQITEHPQSGRNKLYLVRYGEAGRTMLAKLSLASIGAETWFYREVLPALAIAPHCELSSDEDGVVVLELVDAIPLHHISLTEPESALAALPALATPLARLHAHRCRGDAVSPVAILPLPALDPVDLDLLMVANTATVEVIERVQSRSALGTAVHEALTRPGPWGLVHADLKLDNILHAREPGAPIVVDWELGGIGPTGWDLGCVVGAMLVLWCAHLALDSATGPADWIDAGAVPFASVQEAACRFIEDYRRELVSHGAVAANCDQVATFIAANLVARTFAEATQVRHLSPHHLVRLLMAEGILASPDELFGDLQW